MQVARITDIHPACTTLLGGPRSRADVDALHQRLLEIGATVLDAPADYPQYNKGRGYYAVFLSQIYSDGLKLEYVHTPVD